VGQLWASRRCKSLSPAALDYFFETGVLALGNLTSHMSHAVASNSHALATFEHLRDVLSAAQNHVIAAQLRHHSNPLIRWGALIPAEFSLTGKSIARLRRIEVASNGASSLLMHDSMRFAEMKSEVDRLRNWTISTLRSAPYKSDLIVEKVAVRVEALCGDPKRHSFGAGRKEPTEKVRFSNCLSGSR
jgi:hypothetical protein